MDKLSQLILAHTVIGMKQSLYEGDSVMCLCGADLEGMSAHAEHAKHLAEKITEAGYGLPAPATARKFGIGDRVENYKHDKGEVVGWSMHSSGGVTYQVLIPNRGTYTYSQKDLQPA